ncbi:MAG: hypothetical protein AAF704_18660 [Cyanobacteria bacterium P01_D01_bin.123]
MDTEYNAELDIERKSQSLTYAALVKIAQQQGWSVNCDRGKGSHRILERAGYAPIVIKCHGSKTQYARGLSRKYLRAIFQPAIDAKTPRMDDAIAQVESHLDELTAAFQTQAHTSLAELTAASERHIAHREREAWAACERELEEFWRENNAEADRLNRLRRDRDKALRQARTLKAQRDNFQKELQTIYERERTASDRVTQLQQQLKTRERHIDDLIRQAERLQQQSDCLETQLHQNRNRWQKLTTRYRQRFHIVALSLSAAAAIALMPSRSLPAIATILIAPSCLLVTRPENHLP